MATLTYTAYMSRKLIKYGAVALAILVFGWSGLVAAIKAYQAANPPYEAPTVKYGVLPKTVFPEKKYDKKSFTLELPDDALPKFKDQSKVYVIYKPSSRFTALDYYTNIAKNIGFVSSPTEIQTGSGIYEFKDNLNRTLVLNVLDGTFKMSYPYLNDQTLLNVVKLPTKDEATQIAKGFLQQANQLTADLESGTKNVTYWKIDLNNLRLVSAPAEAQLIRVDFFRKDIDETLKIMPAEIGKASVSVLISGSSVEGKRIVEVNYRYVPIDRESFSTYPIKTAEEAWTELKNGNYWPVVDSKNKDVIVRKMYLAYFEPVTLTNYMQPIFVFEGDGGFVAYVPAVTDKYIQN